MKRIIACADHYEALGLLRYKKIDAAFLKKEYRKKNLVVVGLYVFRDVFVVTGSNGCGGWLHTAADGGGARFGGCGWDTLVVDLVVAKFGGG
ncbi:hypothetical protein Hanom_Chr03g00257441 [Helianthus anomalus]